MGIRPIPHGLDDVQGIGCVLRKSVPVYLVGVANVTVVIAAAVTVIVTAAVTPVTNVLIVTVVK